ncbi:hypothetical protein HMPREF0653_01885 [Prevotella disiens JCM 6334 = ATCC 29426]|uniref:Uncharacterized protein n=1 Tax=Prevotella disiens JCM 6334 = ATCC 29426 TaxID=1235811 RepID=A0ABN0NQR2_9BACT|nr:hypothetical protein HMPREF0653_01885 [Prevotella disiens JCM 6334 = ATCC 29426]
MTSKRIAYFSPLQRIDFQENTDWSKFPFFSVLKRVETEYLQPCLNSL